jgi:general secretion pathway protein A
MCFRHLTYFMYERFFGLAKPPFSVVPDPDCVHLTTQHAEAIKGLAFGVLERKGYLMMSAEPGMGKTTALRVLARVLEESRVPTSMIVAPTLTSSEFLEMAMLNFGFKEVPVSKAQRLKKLEEFLLRLDAEDRTAALIIDEAHRLSPDLLEEIRLLGNLEGSDRKLLQIVLAGQKELNDELDLPEFWHLKQRISLRKSLQRLYPQSVEEYIRFRWAQAGGPDPFPFSPEAIDAIAHWSGGVPRVINVICDNSLVVAFSESTRSVDLPMVREACRDLSFPTPVFTRALRSATPQDSVEHSDRPADLSPNHVAALESDESTEPEKLPPWKRWVASRRRPLRSRTGILLLREP